MNSCFSSYHIPTNLPTWFYLFHSKFHYLKVSGNALRVRRHSVLYHGTLLDSFPLGLVGQLLQHPPREPQYRMERQHDKFLANLSIGRKKINKAVQTAFSAWTFRTNWPRDQVHRLVESRYGQSDWTERLWILQKWLPSNTLHVLSPWIKFPRNVRPALFSKPYHHLWEDGMRWGIRANNQAWLVSVIRLHQLCRILISGE